MTGVRGLSAAGKPSAHRALFVLPTDSMGGAERVCVMLVEQALRQATFAGVDVFVLSKPPSGTLDGLSRYKNATITYSNAKRETLGILSFIRFVRKQKYDFTFSTHTHVNALCSFMRRIGVLKTRRLVTRESTMVFAIDFGVKTGLIRLLNFFYGSQDLLVCQTTRMAESYNRATHNRLADRIAVIPNPIDHHRIADSLAKGASAVHLPENCTKIVWCGRLIDTKQPLLAVRALRELHNLGRTDAHLVMVGDGGLRQDLEAEISRSNLGSAVSILGYQKNPIAIMAHCQYGLLTSRTEGFPNVILEMLSAGVRRVVTTDCAGDLDLISGVQVVPSMDEFALAEELKRSFSVDTPENIGAYLKTRSIEGFLAAIL